MPKKAASNHIYILILVLICIACAWLYYFIKYRQASQKNVTPPPTKETIPLTAIYQQENDEENRTLLYDYYTGYKGIGRGQTRAWLYLVGTVDSWQEIPDSQDQYLVVKDPIKNKVLEKVRVVFRDYELDSDNKFVTDLYYENTDSLLKGDNWVERIGSVEDYDPQSLQQLIRPGDAITVLLATKNIVTFDNSDLHEEYQDRNNNSIAFALALRRVNKPESN
jgi:hypothetical protein